MLAPLSLVPRPPHQSSGGERERSGDVPSDDGEFICSLEEQYTRGLCWVLGYYYQVHVHACVDGVQWTTCTGGVY